MSTISIGVQSDGPKDGGIGRIKADLYKALKTSCISTFCNAIDEYAPVIRVDGSIHNFEEEKITRLRFAKKQRYITADIQVPESVWKPKTKNAIREYIASKTKECIELIVVRLKKEKLEIDVSLFKEIDSGIYQSKRLIMKTANNARQPPPNSSAAELKR